MLALQDWDRRLWLTVWGNRTPWTAAMRGSQGSNRIMVQLTQQWNDTAVMSPVCERMLFSSFSLEFRKLWNNVVF